MEHIKPLMAALTIHQKHYRSFGDYSVTSLINTPRIVALKRRYGHLIEINPFSDIASFIGTGVHNYFEETLRTFAALNNDYEVERSVYDKIDDRLVSGTFDILYQGSHIYDIKTCSVWKEIFDPEHTEWVQQQNIYAMLLKLRGIDIQSINIMAVYLDWKAGEAVRDSSYPQERVRVIKLPLWTFNQALAFARNRLAIHKDCENTEPDDLPVCTPEERWERFPGGGSSQFALFKDKDSKRALRVFNSLQELIDTAKTIPSVNTNSIIEVRHAKSKRCEDYCEVNKWCNVYHAYMRDKESGNLNTYIPYSEVA